MQSGLLGKARGCLPTPAARQSRPVDAYQSGLDLFGRPYFRAHGFEADLHWEI